MPVQILVLAALQYEASILRRALIHHELQRDNGHPNPLVSVSVVGPKARHLPAANPAVDIVVMAGLAGGLDPKLRSGDVVLDAPWLTEPIAGCVRGRIESADHLIATPKDKSLLFDRTGGSVVDMENAIARALAEKWNTRFIGLRAVSDPADESLDPALLRIIDPRGRLKLLTLAGEMIRRPALIPMLRRSARQSHQAMQNLCDVLRRILKSEQMQEAPAQSQQ